VNNVTPTPGASWGTSPRGHPEHAPLDVRHRRNSALIVRYAGSDDATLPSDGTTYGLGDAFGTGGTVRYVGSARPSPTPR
jgi:hypothetical protein